MGNFLQKSKHGTVYYFRRRVPLDLQRVVGVCQVFVSLGTTSRPEATESAREFAVRCDQLFAMMRGMSDDEKFNPKTNASLGALLHNRLRQGRLEEKIGDMRADAGVKSKATRR